MKRALCTLILAVSILTGCSSGGETTATTMPTIEASTPGGTPAGTPLQTTPTVPPAQATATTPATEATTPPTKPAATSAPAKNTPAATATTAPAKNTPAATPIANATLPTADCLARLQEGVAEGEAGEYIEAYYPALKACTGVDDWVAAVASASALSGEDPITWAAEVCGLDGPMTSVTCQQAMAGSRPDNGDDGEGVLPTTECLARLEDGEAEGEAGENFEAYYPALKACTGVDDWVAAVEAISALPGENPITWAADVCGLDGPMTSTTCQQAMAASRPDNGDESALPTADCLARLQEAVAVDEDDAYIELYYPALKDCAGLYDWVAAVNETSALPGEDPTIWAAEVCALDGPMTSTTCQQAIASARGQ